MSSRIRSRVVETESVNQRMLQRGAVKRQHIDRWAVGRDELAPGVVGDTHLNPSVVQVIREVGGGAGVGQLLTVSASAQSFASGGDYVAWDSVVYQHGFGTVAATGESVVWPTSAVGEIQVEFEWATYEGGGTIEIEVDGSVPSWGTIATGSAGIRGCKRRTVHIAEGSVVKVLVTQSSGSAKTADVFVEFAIPDPSANGDTQWVLLESVWLENRNNTSVTSTAVLMSDVEHKIVVTGNYDADITSGPYSNPDNVIYVSTGQGASSDAGRDAECDYGEASPVHSTRFTIDVGSGAVHVEPEGGPYSTATAGHTYDYFVTGEGSTVTLDNGDTPTSDNNGQFLVDIYYRAVT